MHASKFNHKTNTTMKSIDFLTVTKMNEARYSDYILFKADEAVTVDTAMVSVYDSELLGCLNEAGAKADAVVRIEGETPYFVFIYSLE